VANGNVFVGRGYAYGTRRAVLVLKWKSEETGTEQRIIIELKMLTERDTYEKVKAAALEQTSVHADNCGASEAHVIIFDRTGKQNWKKTVFTDHGQHGGYDIKIWGM